MKKAKYCFYLLLVTQMVFFKDRGLFTKPIGNKRNQNDTGRG